MDFVFMPQVRRYYESITNAFSLQVVDDLLSYDEVIYSQDNQEKLLELMFFQDGTVDVKLATNAFDVPSPRNYRYLDDFREKLREVNTISPETGIIYPIENLDGSLELILLVLPDKGIQVHKVDDYISPIYLTACQQSEETDSSDCIMRNTINGVNFLEVFTAFREAVENPIISRRAGGANRSPSSELYDRRIPDARRSSLIDAFRFFLRSRPASVLDMRETLYSADLAYGLVIDPIEDILSENNLKTLLFVSEGLMLQAPMAALYDIEEEQFLIEKYALASMPSLERLDVDYLLNQPLSVLAFGLLSGADDVQIPNSDQSLDFGPLPGVLRELENIRTFIPNTEVFVDDAFTPETFQSLLAQSQAPIIHLATHALFNSDPSETFLVTGNGETISTDKLIAFLEVTARNRGADLELLVLSACETARGNEHAALGLAGIVVRSSTRSILASLWLVDDTATQSLMSGFYELMATSEVSKAQALQSAQLRLINGDSRYQHPYYWAPFILVGDWR